MLEPSIPDHEKERIQALHDFQVVNTEPEKEYDDIVKLAAQICNIGTAHISLIDREKQWIKAKIGLGVQNLDRRLAFCAHTILEDDVFIVNDATKDLRFVDHPMVLQEGIRFYAGMPLTTSEGYNIGSLCVIDVVPRELSENQIDALRILSKQIIKQLELRKANRTLIDQSQELIEINEANQKLLFIIGHDVRSPLSSLKNLLDLLLKGSLNETELQRVISLISGTLNSANTLLNDLLQWSAAQQRDGESDSHDVNLMVESLVSQNTAEFIRKKNDVKNLIPGGTYISFDKNVLLFVLRNLLLNANKFTDGGSIVIESVQQNQSLTIRVKDTGLGMRPEQIEQLFNWNLRNSSPGTQGEKGSGLALLLSYDLLKKKGADLLVKSIHKKGSTFSVVIPV